MARSLDAVSEYERGSTFGWFLLLVPRGDPRLLRHPTVRTVVAFTMVYFLGYGPPEPALPLYSRDVLHAGASGYGLLWSAFGAGALLGLVAVPIVSRLRQAGNALLWEATLLPCSSSPTPSRRCSFLPWRVGLGTVPDRGGVPAAAIPLCAGAGGLLLDNVSPTAVIGLSALACMLAGAATPCSPALRRLPAPGTPSRMN